MVITIFDNYFQRIPVANRSYGATDYLKGSRHWLAQEAVFTQVGGQNAVLRAIYVTPLARASGRRLMRPRIEATVQSHQQQALCSYFHLREKNLGAECCWIIESWCVLAGIRASFAASNFCRIVGEQLQLSREIMR